MSHPHPNHCPVLPPTVTGPRFAPIFVKWPKNQTIFEGEDARLECQMLSASAVHVQWLKHYSVNGSYLNEKGEPFITSVPNMEREKEGKEEEALQADLVMTNATMADAGWYTCLLINSFGKSFRSGWINVLPGTVLLLYTVLKEITWLNTFLNVSLFIQTQGV